MRRAALPLLLAACATTAPAPVPAPAPAPAPAATPALAPAMPAPHPLAALPPMTTVVLPSDSPIVSLRLVFRAGSWDDPKGEEGVTALTTRLMVEGGTEALSATELSDALYPMAGELWAETDKELTVIAGRVHKDRLGPFLAILTDVLVHPRLDPKELERLRTSQLNVVKSALRNESDEGLSRAGLDALLYPNHPYRHPRFGTVQALQALTLAQVKAQRARVFTQDRLVLGLAGPVDDALAEQVKQLLHTLPEHGAPFPTPPPAPAPVGRTLILQRDTLSTAGDFGARFALDRADPDFFAVALGMSYLGEHRQQHGELFVELREKRGLNYGTYAYPEAFVEAPGPMPQVNVARSYQAWSLWLRPVEPKNAVFATRAALYFLDQTLNAPLPRERFESAKGFLEGATRLWEQTDQRRLGWAIDDELLGTPRFLERFRAALGALTAEQVQAALRRHLDPKALDFVYVTKDAEGLKRSLASGAPSPIDYPSPKPPEVLQADVPIAKWPLPLDPQAIEVEKADGFMER